MLYWALVFLVIAVIAGLLGFGGVASTAAGIAQVLSVPVGYFFDGLQEENTRAVSPRERMCLELARNFAQIPNERHQEALSQLARVLAAD